MLWTAGAGAYKLCMAEHVRPASCTKSGAYNSWTLTCTGGTITKILGHCHETYVKSYAVTCLNLYYREIVFVLCNIDTIISNGQIMHLNVPVFDNRSLNDCHEFGVKEDKKTTIYNNLNVSYIISKIPF
jgi:hypothetical protein